MPSQRPPKKPLATIAIRQVEKSTGASRNAYEQAAALMELGYEVVILAERGSQDQAKRAGIRLIRLRRWPFKGPFRRFWFNRRVQAWCKRHAPALLISHGDTISHDVVYMHNCVHLASQRIYGEQLKPGHEVAGIHDHVLSQSQFKRVAVNSKMMAEEFKGRYGIDESKLEVSYPGYDPEQFNPDNARRDRNATRASLGVANNEFLIGLLTSGNFKKRNVAGFVEIAALLEQRLPEKCKFLVIGKDDPTPYQRRTEELGLEQRFIWRSTVTDIERYYGALDIFALPAHIEEFGRVALEAMACGTPVMLSAWVGAAELIQGDHSELIIDGNNETWAACLEKLLKSEAREQLGLDLCELAAQFSHKNQYEKLKASFSSLATNEQG